MAELLRPAAVAFALGFGLHVADHARRGLDASPASVAAIGAVQGVLVAVAVWMAWTRRRGAPLAALAVGALSIALVVGGHLLPAGSRPADSFVSPPATNVTWMSWASAYGEIATALAFALAGALALVSARRRATVA